MGGMSYGLTNDEMDAIDDCLDMGPDDNCDTPSSPTERVKTFTCAGASVTIESIDAKEGVAECDISGKDGLV